MRLAPAAAAVFHPAPAMLTGLVLSLLLLHAGAALADGGDNADKPTWTFGGYGTLGVAHSSERQADFTATVLTPGTAGYSRSWSAEVDSRLGMQLGLRVNDAWSAVVQVVSERDLQHSYRPALEWANIAYQAAPDLSVRVGRIALPLFLAGDYRKAGYALPWARPPVELYSVIPISSSDGVDASYRWRLGEVNNATQVLYGHADVRVDAQTRAKARSIAGLSNTSTYGALTLRATLMTTRLDLNLARPLFDAMRQFGPQGEALARRYELLDKRTSVAAIGANYDPGAWFLMAEVGRLTTNSFLGDTDAAYVSAGYRHGNLTPYATVSQVRPTVPTQVSGLDTANLPPQLAPMAGALNGGLNSMLSAIARQRTVTAGVRWDFRPDFALKLQYDRLRPQGGSSGTLINVQPGFRSDHAIGVVSAVIDFVF